MGLFPMPVDLSKCKHFVLDSLMLKVCHIYRGIFQEKSVMHPMLSLTKSMASSANITSSMFTLACSFFLLFFFYFYFSNIISVNDLTGFEVVLYECRCELN